MIREKMDILLIPPVLNSFYSDHSQDFLPLGLVALATALNQQGIHAEIYKPWKRLFTEEDHREVAADILTYPAKITGFSTWCISYPASVLIAKNLKALNPEVSIIFGGPQASLSGEMTMKEFAFIDYVLKGECDFTLPELIRSLQNSSGKTELSKIQGLIYRSESGNIERSPSYGYVKYLDDLPIAEYSFVPSTATLRLDTGRGCPYECTYCSTNDFFSRTYRTKSPERIIREMEEACQKFGVSRFCFAHDMFTLNSSFVSVFCNQLIHLCRDREKKFTWTCSARIDRVSPKQLVLMKEAGCTAIFFGIESGSEKIQRSIRKNLPVDKAYEIADICRESGMEMHASFIIGFPDETEDDIEKTLRSIFRLSLNGVFVQASELSLLPGTPLYINFKEQLAYDGRYSNFSDSFCGTDETHLIRKYPELFSSFYYLQVKAINRDASFFLQSLINNLGEFRNTLFMLRETLEKDLEPISLLQLFLSNLKSIREHVSQGSPIITYIIRQLKNYLISKMPDIINPAIYDVFAFDSTAAMMVARYARWQMVSPSRENLRSGLPEKQKTPAVKLTPYWQNLTTSYDLEAILPSVNGWRRNNPGVKKGVFHYLLVAGSERNCDFCKITEKENILLGKFAGKVSGILNVKAGSPMAGIKMNPFWEKMKRLGVLETEH